MSLDHLQKVLESADMQKVRAGTYCDCQVFNIGDGQPLRRSGGESCNIKYKQEERNWGALRSTNSKRAKKLRGIWEEESALAFRKEQLYSGYQIGKHSPFGEDASQFLPQTLLKPSLTSRKRVDTMRKAA